MQRTAQTTRRNFNNEVAYSVRGLRWGLSCRIMAVVAGKVIQNL